MKKNIFCIIGKSASGKDSIADELLKTGLFERLLPCTTRPRRPKEKEGNPYHFITEDEMEKEMIASVSFTRTDGTYCYGFINQELDPDKDYLTVANISQVLALFEIYGSIFNLRVLEVVTDEEQRIIHAIEREKKNDRNFDEVCRRIEADSYDFSDRNPDYNALFNTEGISVARIYNNYEEKPEEIAEEIVCACV